MDIDMQVPELVGCRGLTRLNKVIETGGVANHKCVLYS